MRGLTYLARVPAWHSMIGLQVTHRLGSAHAKCCFMKCSRSWLIYICVLLTPVVVELMSLIMRSDPPCADALKAR